MRILLYTITFAFSFGQIKVVPQGKNAFAQAMIMERAGNLSEAKLIYAKILEDNPSHQPSFFQIRSIFTREGDYDSAIELVKNWLVSNPNDLQSNLILGEYYFRNQQKEKALDIWENFYKTKLENKTTYRLLFHTYARFGQVAAMENLAQKGRKVFNEPHLFAIDLANYYQSRQTYNRSLREYMILIEHQNQYLQYVTDRILLMSDDEKTHSLIDSTLKIHAIENDNVRKILAGYYYKTGQFNNAFNQQKIIGISKPEDIKRLMSFAENLQKEGDFNLSIEAYHYLLQELSDSNPSIIGKALLGLGQAYEDQIIQDQARLEFVSWFPKNEFFNNKLIKSPDIKNDLLINTVEHYQSILALLKPSNTTAMVHYRLGEIQSKIIRDYEGSLFSYKSALDANPNAKLRKLIKSRIGELNLLSGDYEQAKEYFRTKNNQNIVDDNTIHYINSLLYDKDIETPLSFLDTVITSIKPTHHFFNDILEVHDLIINYYSYGTRNDKVAFKEFFSSEGLIRQYKIPEAIVSLKEISNKYPDALITPLSKLRLAILFVEFREYEKALSVALSIDDSSLKDKGLALAGEIEEKFLGNSENALKHYYRLLSECESSLLIEPIRLNIRKLSKLNES